jgi:hypothetical protein
MGRDLQRDGAGGRAVAIDQAGRLAALHKLLIDGDHPDVGQHGLARDAMCDRLVGVLERLCEDQVYPVAGPDESGFAGDRIDSDGDSACAWCEDGGEEAAIAGAQHVVAGDDVVVAQHAAHHRTDEGIPGLGGITLGAGGILSSGTLRTPRSLGCSRLPARTGCAVAMTATVLTATGLGPALGGDCMETYATRTKPTRSRPAMPMTRVRSMRGQAPCMA